MKPVVISGFPGIGKTYSTYLGTFHCVDSDSSSFSWIETDSPKGKIRNPDFPQNYIKHIKGLINSEERYNFIFVSSHEETRKALYEAGITYILIIPDILRKKEFIDRYKARNSSLVFIELLINNWENWIRECLGDFRPYFVKTLFQDDNLDDYLVDLYKVLS